MRRMIIPMHYGKQIELLAPSCGRILDRFGNQVAHSRPNFRVLLTPEQTASVPETLAELAKFLSIPEEQIQRVLRDVVRQRPFVPVTVLENLTWEDFARINVNLEYYHYTTLNQKFLIV